MTIFDILIVVGLCSACFYSGIRTADKYHEEERRRVDYEVRLTQARIKAHDYSVYVRPAERKLRRMPIGQPFMDKLKTNGRATQQINKTKPIG